MFTCQTMSLIQAVSSCLLLVLLAAAAVATRQLDSDSTAQQPQQHPSEVAANNYPSYEVALVNSSCHGFLIGIGTQKGGTTALWAYIADNAHPHLRVSKTKELGFWDNLHTKYSGCRVGDYLQLQTKDEPGGNAVQQQASSIQQLPICEAISSLWSVPQELMRSKAKPWSASSGARLLQSRDCGILQPSKQLQPSQNASTLPAPAAAEGMASIPAAQPGVAPDVTTARLRLQDGSGSAAVSDASNSRSWLQEMGAAGTPIRGAPAQLILQEPKFPQPMYHADITPRYMFDPAVPPRVRSLLPEARIIVILRDPVARAISNFNMWWQKQSAKPPAERPEQSWSNLLAAQVDGEVMRLSACFAAVSPAPITQPDLANCLGLTHPYSSSYDEDMFANRLLAQGLYADQLQRWFELFPAESFVIWLSEDFKSDSPAHMKDLVQWLRLDMQLLNPKLLDPATRMKSVHSRHYEGKPNGEVIARMRRFFEPHNERLFAMLEEKGFGAVAARMRQAWPQ